MFICNCTPVLRIHGLFLQSSPSTTYNLGINDFYITSVYFPKESDFTFVANLHTLSGNVKNSAGIWDLGRELYLSASYNFLKKTTITWGGSLFSEGKLMKSYFDTSKITREDLGFWSYVMITANF